ncbi:hypothetical protein [Streptomyces sp. H27-H5]|uniref:hypothetical protein n=1 Tax=Streptomyces sp. H27-H5 TaxID=2996460 RepID=UPI00226DE233|nr:hypothetical protein [Streptomyces sp. H27-H5]MCY0957684.1 hypothetical protein [Streptomyces sp. H27-H5]
MSRAARFAATYALLTGAHEVADYIIQSDTDAQTKGKPGREGATACLRHVSTYTLTQAAALYTANRYLDLRLHPARAAAALALSAATHYAADRCAGHWTNTTDQAPTLVRAAHRIGKTGWLTNDHRAGALLDQAWHKGCITLAAAIAAPGRD